MEEATHPYHTHIDPELSDMSATVPVCVSVCCVPCVTC